MKEIAFFSYYSKTEGKVLRVYFQTRWFLSASSQLQLSAFTEEIKVPPSEVTGVVSPAPLRFQTPLKNTGGCL